MKRGTRATYFLFLALAITVLYVGPVFSEDKQDSNMQILRDKVKADKKLIVSENMGLTDAEAKSFWPVYEAYQKDLMAINRRIGRLIDSYEADYMKNALTDEKSEILITDLVGIQKAEAELQASYVPKLKKALPPKKVVRYLQIENKIRAVVKYELASDIPLAK